MTDRQARPTQLMIQRFVNYYRLCILGPHVTDRQVRPTQIMIEGFVNYCRLYILGPHVTDRQVRSTQIIIGLIGLSSNATVNYIGIYQ